MGSDECLSEEGVACNELIAQGEQLARNELNESRENQCEI